MLNKVFKPVNVFAIIILFSIETIADIDARAYTGIYEKINDKYRHLDPNLGQWALDSGIIHNFRFYGNFIAGFDEKGTRIYMKDTSEDPTWNVIKILFPSSPGALLAVISANTNFGRVVIDPLTIAILLKYAQDVRAGISPGKKEIDNLARLITKTLDQSDPVLQNQKDLSALRTKAVIPLLNFVRQSIQNEGTFYNYRSFTETILLAFFAKKFTTQEHIWSLLKYLNQEFNDQVATITGAESENLLSTDDLDMMTKQKEPLNPEQIYNLLQGQMFFTNLPYREGKDPIQQESICRYTRQTDIIDPSKFFSDCGETALRHTVNLLLYNSNTKDFDLSSHNVDKSPFIKNLKEFFALQTAKLANSSDKDIRTAWNKVVADMNAFDSDIKIRYLKDYQNELDPGFINFVRVLQKIFAVPLEELPKDPAEWQSWIEESLPLVFSAMNSRFSYDLTSNLEEAGKDIYGSIQVKVSLGSEDQFSFTIYQEPIHAWIEDIVSLVVIPHKDEKLASYKEAIDNSTVLSKLYPFQESLRLLANRPSKFEPFKSFAKKLDSDEARILWLQIPTEFKETDYSINVKHVLEAMSWDFHTLPTLTEAIRKLLPIPQLNNIVLAETKSLIVDNLWIEGFPLSKFSNLRYLKFTQGLTSHKLSSDDLPPNLEILSLYRPKLAELRLNNLEKLKKLQLAWGVIGNLIINNLDMLDTIYLQNAEIKGPVLLSDFPNLINLSLNRAKIPSLKLQNLPRLHQLKVPTMKSLKELLLDNVSLKKLSIVQSDIQKFEGQNLLELETIDLIGIQNFAELKLSNLPKLVQIDLENSGNPTIDLKHLPKLQNLKFINTEAEIKLDADLEERLKQNLLSIVK